MTDVTYTGQVNGNRSCARTGRSSAFPCRESTTEGVQTMSRSTTKATAGGVLARPIEKGLHSIRTGRFERSLAGFTAFGAAITTLEIYIEHDSASFGNKYMWWPIVILPTLVPAGIAAVFSKRAAHTVLPLTSALVVFNGLQGTWFHVRGVAQRPGGWKLARYNIEMGPPVVAPLLASLVGGMGLLASVLRREGEN